MLRQSVPAPKHSNAGYSDPDPDEDTRRYPAEYGAAIRAQLEEIAKTTRVAGQDNSAVLRRILELLESQSAKHSTLENALYEQSRVIEEMRDRSANLHLRGGVTDSRHDLEIVGIENRLRILSEVVGDAANASRVHSDVAASEQKSTRWVVYMLIPIFTALVEAIRAVFH